MFSILLSVYLASVIITINRYRYVSKRCWHLSPWQEYSHIRNLGCMMIPIVNLIFLLEALETIWTYKTLGGEEIDK